MRKIGTSYKTSLRCDHYNIFEQVESSFLTWVKMNVSADNGVSKDLVGIQNSQLKSEVPTNSHLIP